MTLTTVSFAFLIVATLLVRLLLTSKERWTALAVINLLMLMVVAGRLAPLAIALILVAWLLMRQGGAKMQRWRLVAVIVLGLIFLIGPKLNPHLESERQFPMLIGASYLAFCLIGLAVDRTRGHVTKVGFVDFWNWISFFPSFTAGPIRRYMPFVEQLSTSTRLQDIWWGATRLLIGIFKRLVLVSMLTPTANFLNETGASTWQCWLGMYAYTLKIYLDFSAYTDIALGAAGMLGLKIEENFNWPYLATNISTFWKRWHMSLTGWLRDYLFIPLGGSRAGWPRTALNTVVIMVVIGLWHGLAWHYLAWGLYHAAGLLIYRAYTDLFRGGDRGIRPGLWRRLGAGLFTFHFVAFGWLLFACDVQQAWRVVVTMFTGG